LPALTSSSYVSNPWLSEASAECEFPAESCRTAAEDEEEEEVVESIVEATGGTEKDAGEAAASIGVVKENASRGKGENVKLEVSTFASSKWTDIFLQQI
jgi:hypothetical protein